MVGEELGQARCLLILQFVQPANGLCLCCPAHRHVHRHIGLVCIAQTDHRLPHRSLIQPPPVVVGQRDIESLAGHRRPHQCKQFILKLIHFGCKGSTKFRFSEDNAKKFGILQLGAWPQSAEQLRAQREVVSSADKKYR